MVSLQSSSPVWSSSVCYTLVLYFHCQKMWIEQKEPLLAVQTVVVFQYQNVKELFPEASQ